MTTRLGLVLLLVVFAIQTSNFVPAQAQQKPEELAKQSSEAWLALIDSGKYSESYDQTAAYFKNAITRPEWQKSLHGVREPLGKLRSRSLKTATYAKSLPGAPDGEYVVIQYESSFENKQSAIETVTPMLDTDGNWRVSGYYIK